VKIFFRSPEFPVIVISRDRLLTGSGLKTLARALSSSIPLEGKNLIQLIDSTGEEFWFHIEKEVLSPGLVQKRWPKKRIVDLYNSSLNPNEPQKAYSTKSLPNKRLATGYPRDMRINR
jgi:hypothetical protein